MGQQLDSPSKETVPKRSTLKPAKRKIITLDSDNDFELCDGPPSPTPVRAKAKSAGKLGRQPQAKREVGESTKDFGSKAETASTAQVAEADRKPISTITLDFKEVRKPQPEIQRSSINIQEGQGSTQ